ncbi:MAG: hypothetical protein M3R58_12525 [Pseudomonadota bacterium]|nr:hypothetical protein [Pseudomonadota bacterium]
MRVAAAVPFLAMALAAIALFACVRLLLVAPCWGAVLLVAAIAWPMWIGQREYALFQHRLALGAATIVASRIRRWLWRGRLTSAAQALSAIFWAGVLLALAPLLHPLHIALLAADVVLLAVLERVARRMLQADIRAEYLGLLARRWLLLLLNVVFLAASFFVIDYFLVGAPDTRAMDWNVVAARAYGEFGGAACPLVGMVVGAINAADRMTWHAAEVIIPGLPGSGLRLVAWLVFLLQAGAVAFAYTRYLLGALAVVARREPGVDTPRDGMVPTTIATIAAALLLGTWALRDFDPAMVAPAARALVHRLDPCRVADTSIVAARRELDAQIDAAAAADRQRAGMRIDRELDALFVRVEGGVDSYLDWYFSVLGGYQRLGAQVLARSADGAAARVTQELEQRLFGATDIGAGLDEANRRIAADAATQLVAVSSQLGTRLRTEAASQPCWRQSLDLPRLTAFEHDALRVSASIASGLAVGAATSRVAAGRLSNAAAARLASKRAYGSAAGVAGRFVNRRAGSLVISAGAGVVACAPGGPLALLCGLVTGAVTWVSVDKALVMVDEFRFRKEMRAEILETVREQKAELAREMHAAHGAAIDAVAQRLHVAVNGVFIPARDARQTLPARAAMRR